MEMIPDKRKVVNLVEQAHEGKLCLPNFQRDFVWKREQVADLLRSVVRRFYIGSLLLLRCDPQHPPFAPIHLRGARPLHSDPSPELLVLDGQQRLSALLYALTAPDLRLKDSSRRRWFFLNLELLLKDPTDDEIVFDRSESELDGLDREEDQFRRRILPFTRLIRSSDFMTWRDGLDDWLREQEPEAHRRFRTEWRDPWTKAATDFQSFEVPLVELPRVEESDTEGIGRVCAIFEKLNSTGVELSVYDLLTARLYRHGIRLHDLWSQACREHRLLAEWSEGKADTNKFGVLVLRTMALLRGLEAKPSALINLKPEGFETDWGSAAAAMERALALVTLVSADGFGVFDRKWLAVYGILPVVAALRATVENLRLGEAARADLRRWFWCNLFLERYSSAVESKSRKDYSEMLRYWTEGKPEPAVFAEARARVGAQGYSVRDSASHASTIYTGVFCLLALRGARDWRVGEDIRLQDLQDHHIFPQAYLRSHDIDNRAGMNTIANRTLVSDETNNRIRGKAPAAYINDPAVFGGAPPEGLLTPHFLVPAAIRSMRSATDSLSDVEAAQVYEEFCATREAAIIAEIRRVCGLSQSNEDTH